MSSPSEGDFKEFILSDKLSDLENFNADNVLTEELKEMIKEIDDYRDEIHEEFDEIKYLIKFADNTTLHPCCIQEILATFALFIFS